MGPVPEGYRPNAGVMLIDRRGLVFGGQRIDNPGPAWQMPQGGLDAGEDVETGALRELEEETGIPASLVRVLGVSDRWLTYELPDDLRARLWGGRYVGQAQAWVAARFLGTDADVAIDGPEAEFSRWRWMTAAALIEAAVPFKRHVYEAAFADLGHLAAPE